MTYLNDGQISQLLKAINPKRVGKDGKGFSHVEAYEIRAHLNRIMGFARWSADVTAQELIFETSAMLRKKDKQGKEYGDPYEAWTVCYRTILRLTVCAPDGTMLATYTEGATGEAKNQPGRGDAHDLALKTSESQAFKRCAMNLGDQYGLSLWGKGSLAALVKQTLISPQTQAADTAIDAHIESTPPENEPTAPPDPADDPRSTNGHTAPVVDGAAVKLANELRDRIIEGPLDHDPKAWIANLLKDAARGKVQAVRVQDDQGNDVDVKTLIMNAAKMVAA